MADTKITGLTENTTPVSTDIIPMVDDPGGTPVTQKVTLSNLRKAIVAGSDTQVQYNASGTLGGISNATSDGTTLTLTSPKVITGINDTNGNELIKVTATGSAINEFTVVNAASGNPPELQATGGGTNIDIKLVPKGTGNVNIPTGELFLDTNETKQHIGFGGSNRYGLGVFGACTALTVHTGGAGSSFGTWDGASYSEKARIDNSGRMKLGASGAPTAGLHLPAGTATANTAPLKFTSGTVLSSIEAGTMEYDGSDFFISPTSSNRLSLTQMGAKFWVKATGNSTTINASYNTTSLTDTGVGDMTVTIATDFSSAHWCCLLSCDHSNTGTGSTSAIPCEDVGTMAAGTIQIKCFEADPSGTNPATSDPAFWYVSGYGLQ